MQSKYELFFNNSRPIVQQVDYLKTCEYFLYSSSPIRTNFQKLLIFSRQKLGLHMETEKFLPGNFDVYQ
jgi:hypothetical protein